jgi:uncharacterized membrane protein
MMTPRLRKFALTAHVTSSVGWLGTAAAFQALAIAAVRSGESEAVRGFYSGMALIGWYVIVPFCVASLVTGLIMSLATPWGLFRHYWVLVKFLITVVAALVLFGFTQTLSSLGHLAADPALSTEELRNLKQSPVLHSGGGLLVLLVTTFLAVYKPWGLTRYGRRRLNLSTDSDSGLNPASRWKQYLLLATLGLVLLLLIVHLIGGGPRGH